MVSVALAYDCFDAVRAWFREYDGFVGSNVDYFFVVGTGDFLVLFHREPRQESKEASLSGFGLYIAVLDDDYQQLSLSASRSVIVLVKFNGSKSSLSPHVAFTLASPVIIYLVVCPFFHPYLSVQHGHVHIFVCMVLRFSRAQNHGFLSFGQLEPCHNVTISRKMENRSSHECWYGYDIGEISGGIGQ